MIGIEVFPSSIFRILSSTIKYCVNTLQRIDINIIIVIATKNVIWISVHWLMYFFGLCICLCICLWWVLLGFVYSDMAFAYVCLSKIINTYTATHSYRHFIIAYTIHIIHRQHSIFYIYSLLSLTNMNISKRFAPVSTSSMWMYLCLFLCAVSWKCSNRRHLMQNSKMVSFRSKFH